MTREGGQRICVLCGHGCSPSTEDIDKGAEGHSRQLLCVEILGTTFLIQRPSFPKLCRTLSLYVELLVVGGGFSETHCPISSPGLSSLERGLLSVDPSRRDVG